MTNQSTDQVVSLLERGVVAYSKFMTDAITGLSEAFGRMTLENKAEGERRLLREFERGLQRLADAVSHCEGESRQARIAGRGLKDNEYKAVAQAWADSRRAHLEAQALASRICSNARWKQWEQLTGELEKASNCLEETITDETRRDIPTRVWEYSNVLARLQTEVSGELDSLLESGQRLSGEEVH